MSSKAVPEPVTKLIDAFSRLPGVGPKTASRLTYYLLRQPEEVTIQLADALNDLRTNTRFCSVCFNITVNDPCPICSDSQRDHHKILVVEEPLDVLAIERTGMYDGVYHVLHGAVDYVAGIGIDSLKIRELVQRVEKGDALEIIIATNPSQEGDATAMYIQRELKPKGVKITRLARGLPMGGDIEYVDTVTLSRALQGRNEL
jgi:recombination protein RecR